MELLVAVVALITGCVAIVMLARRAPHGAGGTADMRERLSELGNGLAAVTAVLAERKALEERTSEAVTKIQQIITGSYSKGRAGENLLEAALGALPAEMLTRDAGIGGRRCEFALRMPDGKLLAVDSKWPSADLVSALDSAEDMNEKESLRRQVEAEVIRKLKEVNAYVCAPLTVRFAIMAVPDQVYACCRKAHAQARHHRVVIVGYSSAMALLLTIWNMYDAEAAASDESQLASAVAGLVTVISEMSDKLEGHLARGLRQAVNATEDMRHLVGKASALTGVLSAREAGPDSSGSVQDLPDVDFRARAV